MEAAGTRESLIVEHLLRATDEVRDLIAALDDELSQHYVPEQRHGLKLDAIFQPHVRFYIVRMDGLAVGCGGVALFADFAELKRMFVRSGSRGKGVADAIIAQLEKEAVEAGLRLLRLETGTLQIAAIRFYERYGYRTCPAFQPYASMPPAAIATSVFMEKRLV